MKIFYHIDQDGKCAGYVVRKYREADVDKTEVGYYPMNYGWEFPFDEIYENEEIYIVDFSISPEDMDKLLEITKNVVWIDHHATAIKKYDNYNKEIYGLRNTRYAGCKLAEIYMRYMSTTSGSDTDENFKVSQIEDKGCYTDSFIDTCEEMVTANPTYKGPSIIDYVHDWDTWTFKYGKQTKAIHMAIELQVNEPDSIIWDMLYHDRNELNQFADIGYNILKYQETISETLCKSYGFECEFEGHKAYALNISSAIANSDWFNSVDQSEYDMLIMFNYNGVDWSYGLRAVDKKCNVGEIALKYDGGGHPGAAGFHHADLLLHKLEREEGDTENGKGNNDE